MNMFRVLLAAIWVVVFTYTGIVVANHGLGFLPVFFGDMVRMGWAGQFNLDFMFMLLLGAIWVAWRHEFSYEGLCLAVLAFFGGVFFLSAYLLVTSYLVRGDAVRLLVGSQRMKHG